MIGKSSNSVSLVEFLQRISLPLVLVATFSACGSDDRGSSAVRKAYADVDTARIVAADEEPGNWMTHGRTYDEQRFSPLQQINADNVGSLKLAWSFDLDTDRGQEATPIVVDGVMYVSTAWSKVKALNAANGELVWEYDPQVPGQKAVEVCCDVVNRGVAVWKGRVFVGTLDGRLVAIDAATGDRVWETQTTDPDKPFSITGAPRIMNDRIVVVSHRLEQAHQS
jgi:glucose dehydrogenase